MTKSGSTLEFLYNADGIRTSKTVNNVEHIYTLNGSQIVSEAWLNNLVVYLYDESGSPIGMQYRTTSYAAHAFDTFYFAKNLQGDIIAVYNADGEKVGSYTYDAWGNCTASVVSGNTTLENNIVRTYNPFRYRGYYYDTETGLYYLQSRYYTPEWGRFLNADGYVNANGDLVGYNMYAYCNNNPVLYFDSSGHSWKSVLAGAISLLTIIAVVTLEILSPSKEEHYARNSHNEIPDDDELLGIVQGENDKWHKADDSMNRYHRNTNGIQGEEAMYNKKYMTEGNESEVIICYDPVHVPVPYRVTDPNNIGTYNYGEGIFEHFVYDVWPYWKWGNSPDDTTSEWDHIVGRN